MNNITSKNYLEDTYIRVIEFDDGFMSLHNMSGFIEEGEEYDRISLDENDQKALQKYLNEKFPPA